MEADLSLSRALAGPAAAIEPAVFFPPPYLTRILKPKHVTGSISFGGDHILSPLEEVCDEIARDWLSKTVLLITRDVAASAWLPSSCGSCWSGRGAPWNISLS